MTRDDGTPLFTTATAAAALVFFVLAMQCLPTLAVTRRETGTSVRGASSWPTCRCWRIAWPRSCITAFWQRGSNEHAGSGPDRVARRAGRGHDDRTPGAVDVRLEAYRRSMRVVHEMPGD